MKKLGFIAACALTLLLGACNKEVSDNFNLYTGHPLNDTVWVRNVPSTASIHELISLLAPDVIVDSFETIKDTTLKYGDSLEVVFTAGSCVNPGSSIALTGKVKMELVRLKKKGDFIKTFTPTTSNGSILEAANAFFLRISKDNRELTLAPGTTVKIRFADTTDPKPNMQVFNGRESNPLPLAGIDTSFTWIRDNDTSYINTFQKQGQTGIVIKGYEMIAKNLRWVGAERFSDSTRAKAKITAILPPNYTNKNTVAFAVFADQRTVVQMKADYNSRSFAASNIPVGTKLKIVTVSKIGDALYLGTRDVNDVGTAVYYSITPEKSTLKDILAFINGL